MQLSITQHQNGFLKVALPLGNRLHVWSPWNPAVTADAQIHDHPFSFRSVCLAGEMINVEYDVIEDKMGQYTEYEAQCVSSFCKQPIPQLTERRVNLKQKSVKIIRRGESYSMQEGAIHSTDAVFAITLFTKLHHSPNHSKLYAINNNNVQTEHRPQNEDLLRMSLSTALRAAHLTLDDVCSIEENIVMSCPTLASATLQTVPLAKNPGYHLREFVKSVHGSPEKIVEEALELLEATEQGIRVMALHECADVISAIRGYMKREFPGIDFSEILAMSFATDRAFNSGKRK